MFAAAATEEQTTEEEILALPSSSADGSAHQLNIGGSSHSMDYLGPMIVNADGSLRRITNWDELSPEEQANTKRIVVERNRKRLLKLKEKMAAKEAEEKGKEEN